MLLPTPFKLHRVIRRVQRAVHKRRPQSVGGRSLSIADICRQGGVLQMRTSALFGVKNVGFFEIYGVSERPRGRGWVSAVILLSREEGVNFPRFYADVFY